MRWIKVKDKWVKSEGATRDYYKSDSYARELRERLKKKWVYCDTCKSKYNLAYPCVHHLPDVQMKYKSPKEIREMLRGAENKKMNIDEPETETNKNKNLFE
jgi:hypothetical protein